MDSRKYKTKIQAAILVTTLFFIAGFMLVPEVQAENPHFTTIDFPGAGFTNANAVNDSGDIVGVYRTRTATGALAAPRGFLLRNGQFSTISVPGAGRTRAFGSMMQAILSATTC
jgi:hypothetical protein